ncbi:MAG TPA: hypothetical protein VGI10_15550 [Polyangiaceae bacterium]|jgi:hypothetical protein
MRTFLIGWLSCAACLTPLVVDSTAWAQTDDAARSAAREVGTVGVEAFQRQDYVTASDKLEKAYQVLRVPSLGLWSARALAKLGKLVKASERYREVTRLDVSQGEVAVQKQAQADAASELAQLTPRIPTVVVQLEGAPTTETKLTIDGAPMSSALIGERWPVDPGKHLVQASSADGNASQQITLAEGDSKPVVLHMQGSAGAAAPTNAAQPTNTAEPPSRSGGSPSSTFGTQKVLALTAGGIGVVGIAIGSVFGLQASSKNDQAKSLHCSGSTCPSADGVNLSRDAAKAGNLSTVAFIVGGVGLAAGATLWLTASSAPAQVGVGPGTIELRRTW